MIQPEIWSGSYMYKDCHSPRSNRSHLDSLSGTDVNQRESEDENL